MTGPLGLQPSDDQGKSKRKTGRKKKDRQKQKHAQGNAEGGKSRKGSKLVAFQYLLAAKSPVPVTHYLNHPKGQEGVGKVFSAHEHLLHT